MVKLMIDSAADCRNDAFYDYYVPITVIIDGREYQDGIDLDFDGFYRKLSEAREFPKTSQPAPDTFASLFEQVKADGDELIYIALSSALSGTYQCAVIAKELVGYDRIHLIDSKNASHMIELLAAYARRLIDEGLVAREIVEKCESLKSRIRAFAGLDTLEYLRRGGRIGKAAALFGSLASIKPIVTVSPEGEVDAAGKALGFTRAVHTIAAQLDKTEIDESFPIYSLFSGDEANCEKLEAFLTAKGYILSGRKQIGPTIGTHVGPGAFGVYFVEKSGPAGNPPRIKSAVIRADLSGRVPFYRE